MQKYLFLQMVKTDIITKIISLRIMHNIYMQILQSTLRVIISITFA